MGLPNMLLDDALVGGDLGAPNKGFEAVTDGTAAELLPKLNIGFVASDLAIAGSAGVGGAAPNKGC